jgi:hypothetical protein
VYVDCRITVRRLHDEVRAFPPIRRGGWIHPQRRRPVAGDPEIPDWVPVLHDWGGVGVGFGGCYKTREHHGAYAKLTTGRLMRNDRAQRIWDA